MRISKLERWGIGKTVLIVIVIIVIVVIGGAAAVYFRTATSSSTTTFVTSSSPGGRLFVTCISCSGGDTQSAQFTGDIDNNGASSTVQGSGNQSYPITFGSGPWAVSWDFQKQTSLLTT